MRVLTAALAGSLSVHAALLGIVEGTRSTGSMKASRNAQASTLLFTFPRAVVPGKKTAKQKKEILPLLKPAPFAPNVKNGAQNAGSLMQEGTEQEPEVFFQKLHARIQETLAAGSPPPTPDRASSPIRTQVRLTLSRVSGLEAIELRASTGHRPLDEWIRTRLSGLRLPPDLLPSSLFAGREKEIQAEVPIELSPRSRL
jgi:hypothetical protein